MRLRGFFSFRRASSSPPFLEGFVEIESAERGEGKDGG